MLRRVSASTDAISSMSVAMLSAASAEVPDELQQRLVLRAAPIPKGVADKSVNAPLCLAGRRTPFLLGFRGWLTMFGAAHTGRGITHIPKQALLSHGTLLLSCGLLASTHPDTQGYGLMVASHRRAPAQLTTTIDQRRLNSLTSGYVRWRATGDEVRRAAVLPAPWRVSKAAIGRSCRGYREGARHVLRGWRPLIQ